MHIHAVTLLSDPLSTAQQAAGGLLVPTVTLCARAVADEGGGGLIEAAHLPRLRLPRHDCPRSEEGLDDHFGNLSSGRRTASIPRGAVSGGGMLAVWKGREG